MSLTVCFSSRAVEVNGAVFFIDFEFTNPCSRKIVAISGRRNFSAVSRAVSSDLLTVFLLIISLWFSNARTICK